MPYGALTTAEVESSLKGMEPDLQFVLEEAGVSELGRAHLGRVARTIATFKNLADDRTEWRKLIAEDLHIGAEDGLAGKAEVSAIISAWEAAEAWKSVKDRSDADDRLLGRPRTLKPSEFTRTRASFVEAYGELDDLYAPAKPLVELLQQQLEEGEFRAESLSEIPSVGECDGEPELTPIMAKDGTVKFRKASRVGNSAPTTQEQFRRRMRVLGNAYLYVKLRHPTHAALRTASADMWAAYSDYILGPKVAGQEVKDENGRVVAAPSWALVCSYDYQVRRRMCHNINVEGMSLRDALQAAVKDQELKTTFFTSPLAVSVRVSPPQSSWGPSASSSGKGPSSQAKGGKSGSKGRGVKRDQGGRKEPRGKASGPYKVPGVQFKMKTKDGSLICYRFNNKGEVCDGKCGKVHVCQVCDGPDNNHPYHECPTYKAALKKTYQ